MIAEKTEISCFAFQNHSLSINRAKTNARTNTQEKLEIALEGEQLEYALEYVYLSQIIKPNKKNQKAEIIRRIKLGWAASAKLRYILPNK